ncbi:hypothetical protein AVEN_50793-1 [Araneus ventricosus]|uniref:Uncharacterized protein n=1 Tax=Araneus ventricosus TaxID=182803 RepID=A0A4Y2IU24_ARAVE|nr:hypothetical protein AVEN_50793-1 [Araneus ventricosus]
MLAPKLGILTDLVKSSSVQTSCRAHELYVSFFSSTKPKSVGLPSPTLCVLSISGNSLPAYQANGFLGDYHLQDGCRSFAIQMKVGHLGSFPDSWFSEQLIPLGDLVPEKVKPNRCKRPCSVLTTPRASSSSNNCSRMEILFFIKPRSPNYVAKKDADLVFVPFISTTSTKEFSSIP